MPIYSHELCASRPEMMGLIIGRAQAEPLWISSDNVRSSVLNEVHHGLSKHLVCGIFGQRKHMLRGVRFLLVDSSTFDADGVNQKRSKLE